MLSQSLCSGAADLSFGGLTLPYKLFILLQASVLEATEFRSFNWAQRKSFSHFLWTSLLIMQAKVFSKDQWVLSSVLNMERTWLKSKTRQTNPESCCLLQECSPVLFAGMLGLVSVADYRGLLKFSFPNMLLSSWNKGFDMFVQNLRNGNAVGLQNAHFPQPPDRVSSGQQWIKGFSLVYECFICLFASEPCSCCPEFPRNTRIEQYY